jgi:hypothetical protein
VRERESLASYTTLDPISLLSHSSSSRTVFTVLTLQYRVASKRLEEVLGIVIGVFLSSFFYLDLIDFKARISSNR